MSDIFTSAKRSEIMSKISGTETQPEIIIRKLLFSLGYRYRKNVKNLPGKPDIVLPKFKTVIFVHGCFWHQHKNCKKSALPESNKEKWKTKLQRNVERDKSNIKDLKKLGWKVIVIWECEINKKFDKVKNKLLKALL
ncbi:MAG: DNA mismatch endonuclease Vsr [bacterium]